MVIKTALALALLWSAPGKSYYFSVSGNDAAAGSRGHPFRTLKKLNSLKLGAGDTVFLKGGDMFTGTIRLPEGVTGAPGHPVVITSYDQGSACIDAGEGNAIALYKAAYISLSSLELKGAGRKEGNTQAGLTVNTCRHVRAANLTVHGFQKGGVYIYASSYVEIAHTLARDNGYAGISADGPYGRRDCHHLRISDCRAENNPGDPTNLTNHSGNGIVVGFCRSVVIEKCVATGNGWDMPRIGNGPVGIWAYESDSVKIQYCTSFRNRTAKGADDGGGFDLDGGVAHSVIDHCLSYENEGSGFGLFQYAGATPWHDNTVHDCVSNNDGLVSAARAGVFIWNSSRDPQQLRNCHFYNNVIYNTKGAAIHYASEGEHSGFYFHDNAFVTSDSLIKGAGAADDIFRDNHWTGLLRDSTNTNAIDTTRRQWMDTEGHPINAHGAGVMYHQGVWYLYGEIKKGTTHLVPGQDWEDYRVDAGGISCYSSTDLTHWRYEGIALTPDKKDTASDLHIGRVIERPKVIYNAFSRQFVMWMHIDREDYSFARAGVAVSDKPQGPYRYIRSIRPDGSMSRDMTLFKDDDERAYLVYTSENNNTMHVSLLTKDYLSPAGNWKRILVGQRREAPAVFKQAGKYYLITSLCTGWDPNPATYAVADSMLGSWVQQGNPCQGPDAATTFHSQSTYVLPLQPGHGRFLFMADRWNKTDLEHSGYCWLPLTVKEGRVEIREDTTVLQQLKASPLSVVDYSMRLEGKPGTRATTYLRCYDSTGHLLLQYAMPCTITGDGVNTGNYVETPAYTAYITINLEQDAGAVIRISNLASHVIRDPSRASPAPLCHLDKWMRPFWRSDTIFSETVLLLSKNNSPAGGDLLYTPGRIISVTNFGLDTLYQAGRDYRVIGRTIYGQPHSLMPSRQDTSFDRAHNLAWYDLQSQWVSVTYTRQNDWIGPVPSFKGSLLPRTISRLRDRLPLTLLAYGMSITRGMDVSGYDSVRPYMPTYMDLFAMSLKNAWPGSHIALLNAGLPGATVSWGAEHVSELVTPFHPDLTVIDFGMNDFWRMAPGDFGDSVKSIIRKVRAADPAAEFILLANIPFDPDYVLSSDKYRSYYMENLAGYSSVLKELEGPGIACLDMYAIGEAIYRRKKAKDCLANPLHPNDYLARWYAQSLTALLKNP